ncbi:Armadillo-type fold [Pseudocohnilembus persalinus]|uniref:Armadillo-type fold n=1 Tax=Pseudocohnilembus persalinus TaxID=266149 RepID=A0A0V0QKC6_PSEPJ|nr:Armadillo-type fold [Pseudocohnilembus persalinus]|eukprot:KRX02552.1 Armadillo-type fold [Pseudocohnilembus persalinus]
MNFCQFQLTRIRKVTLDALCSILLTQQGGGSIEHVMPSLNKIVYDHNNDVRKATYQALGKILNGFSIGNLKMYESDLLILLLNGLSDEIPEIVQESQKIIEEVGLKRKVLSIEMEENIEEFL